MPRPLTSFGTQQDVHTISCAINVEKARETATMLQTILLLVYTLLKMWKTKENNRNKDALYASKLLRKCHHMSFCSVKTRENNIVPLWTSF